jgi:hypothetical protein
MPEWAARYEKDAPTIYIDGRKFLGVVRQNQERDHRACFRIAGRVPRQTLAHGDYQDVLQKGRLTLIVTSRIAADATSTCVPGTTRPAGATALITGTDTARMPGGTSEVRKASAFSAATLWREIHSLFSIG